VPHQLAYTLNMLYNNVLTLPVNHTRRAAGV